ncbi:MAG: hypothetical protein E7501_03515 [Ruminococcus sp.]|nr:hypothetical protein [Ruminococcus sp.]
MFPTSCDAVLKNHKNQTLEVGTATVSITNRSADFVAPFVPLVKLGDEAKIICTHQNIATHVITGKVYLSSDKLLRLIEIKCTLLPNAENVLATNEEIPAEIYLPVFNTDFLGKKFIYTWQSCTILGVSADTIQLRCKRLPDEYVGQVRVRLTHPLFDELTEVTLNINGKGILFGKQAKYECRYGGLSTRQTARISDYIRSFSIRILRDTV